MEQLQGPRCGPTRPLAFNEAASRPPLWVDSSTALAFNEAMSRGWIDTTYRLSHSKECEKGRAEVLGTFSARAHRECKVQQRCARLQLSRRP